MSATFNWRKTGAHLLGYAALLATTAVFLYPVVYMVASSLRYGTAALEVPPRLFFFWPSWDSYRSVFATTDFGRDFVNSVIISTLSVALSLALGVPAAYALARYRFRGASDIAFFVLSTRMTPPIAAAIPYFLLAKQLGLLDRHAGLVIMYTLGNLSFAIWMLRAFIAEIPAEIEDAALVDGCSRWSILSRVVLPLVGPGLAATAVFCFIMSWNEFLFAFLFTGREAKTAPVAIAGFITALGIRWGEMSAAGTMVVAPVLAFAILVRRQLVRGMTLGGVNG